jgi:hypothetical protein
MIDGRRLVSLATLVGMGKEVKRLIIVVPRFQGWVCAASFLTSAAHVADSDARLYRNRRRFSSEMPSRAATTRREQWVSSGDMAT